MAARGGRGGAPRGRGRGQRGGQKGWGSLNKGAVTSAADFMTKDVDAVTLMQLSENLHKKAQKKLKTAVDKQQIDLNKVKQKHGLSTKDTEKQIYAVLDKKGKKAELKYLVSEKTYRPANKSEYKMEFGKSYGSPGHNIIELDGIATPEELEALGPDDALSVAMTGEKGAAKRKFTQAWARMLKTKDEREYQKSKKQVEESGVTYEGNLPAFLEGYQKLTTIDENVVLKNTSVTSVLALAVQAGLKISVNGKGKYAIVVESPDPFDLSGKSKINEFYVLSWTGNYYTKKFDGTPIAYRTDMTPDEIVDVVDFATRKKLYMRGIYDWRLVARGDTGLEFRNADIVITEVD